MLLLDNADRTIDGRPWVELIKIDGSINPAVAHFLEDSIASAQMGGARALIVELDTPGGLMSSTERIIKDLFAAPVPVIVYVAPTGASAASAGTFITQAASLAAMAPGTNIGAAHPVTESGGDVKGELGTKVENFAAMLARNTARQRGRNEDWAEKAVRDSVMIGDREALESKVVEIVAVNIPDLLKQADGRTVEVGDHKVTLQLKDAVVRQRSMTFGQNVLDTLADPNIVYLLLMAGLLGLYFEFAHPGVYLPGVAGAICLLLALASFQVLPVTLSGLLLMLLGVGMLISEAFVASYGVMGIGGVIALLFGSLLLIDTSKTNLDGPAQHHLWSGGLALRHHPFDRILRRARARTRRDHRQRRSDRRTGRGARSRRARFSRQGFRAWRNLARAQRRSASARRPCAHHVGKRSGSARSTGCITAAAATAGTIVISGGKHHGGSRSGAGCSYFLLCDFPARWHPRAQRI